MGWLAGETLRTIVGSFHRVRDSPWGSHSPLSGAEAKNMWSCAPVSTCPHGMSTIAGGRVDTPQGSGFNGRSRCYLCGRRKDSARGAQGAWEIIT
jgi:hypothetical protein